MIVYAIYVHDEKIIKCISKLNTVLKVVVTIETTTFEMMLMVIGYVRVRGVCV